MQDLRHQVRVSFATAVLDGTLEKVLREVTERDLALSPQSDSKDGMPYEVVASGPDATLKQAAEAGQGQIQSAKLVQQTSESVVPSLVEEKETQQTSIEQSLQQEMQQTGTSPAEPLK
eukprot:4323373-Amphidinium_carterae.1